ncbi:hypothetical protein QBC33DRAFT_577861 [Phialemonium atrogriseum]|uniref:Uncharacterized protein n=1 Tax=Phialemonium atrogriseum TaxID=1093897 RepID=A0AAJ0C171_9PEZI|nr:uncharacterized protein QBC33DRAFT_577861 [Phialemonium atrogriseum]KAK1768260.1 hypothetical protein QBC33DRAFT_577861 [Phialemonium atrogriseum]
MEDEHVMAEIMLSEDIDEEGDFRPRIDASSSFQRETITDGRGVVDIRCVAKDVIHGYFKHGFQFDSHKGTRRIAKVDIQFVYEGDEIGSELDVFEIAPKGRWTLEPREQTDVMIGGEGADNWAAKSGYKLKRTTTRGMQHGTTVVGSTEVTNRIHGPPNVARWSLMENTSAGVPTIFRAVVLLRREDDFPFHSSVKVKASVDWKRRLSPLFGATPADHHILYDPRLPPTNKLHICDTYNLGHVSLRGLMRN